MCLVYTGEDSVPNVFQKLTPTPLSCEERGLSCLFSPLLIGEGLGGEVKENVRNRAGEDGHRQ